MPGPAGKFDPSRRNATVGKQTLPIAGRTDPPPPWPLPEQPESYMEWQLWETLWKSPQATQWERQGIGTMLVVARYVQLLVRCQNPKASSVIHGQAGMLEDKLGLTPKAMRMLLWEVAEPPPEKNERNTRMSARDRMRAKQTE